MASTSILGAAPRGAVDVKAAAGNAARVENLQKQFKTLQKRELRGHSKKVHSVGWSSDGRRLASGSVDMTVKIWSIDARGQQGTELELKGHTEGVDQLCWHKSHPDLLATASGDKSVRVWDARTGKCTQTVATRGQNINISWTADGKYICVGNKKDQLSFIDTKTWQIVSTHEYKSQVNEFAWNKSSEYMVFTTSTGYLDVLRFPSMERVHTVKAHGGNCYTLQIDPTGRYIATGGADAMVNLWDTNEMVCLRAIDRLEGAVRSVSFSHDGQLVASAGEDPKIDISDVETGAHVHTLECRDIMPFSLAWSTKTQLLAVAGEEGSRGFVHVFGFTQ